MTAFNFITSPGYPIFITTIYWEIIAEKNFHRSIPQSLFIGKLDRWVYWVNWQKVIEEIS